MDVFGDQPQGNEDITFDTLVGEGKKYKSENDLARAYANADGHIEELRRDLAQLRAERDTNSKQPEANQEQQQNRQDPPQKPADTPKPQNEEAWRAQIREELKTLSQEERFEQNIETTAAKLVEVYGDGAKANQMVKDRARELGVSVEWLRDAAARSPSAFYASMGIPQDNQANNRETPAPKNEMRTEQRPSSNKQGYAFYQDMRKNDKARYYSVDVQREMQEKARELGDAFYAN